MNSSHPLFLQSETSIVKCCHSTPVKRGILSLRRAENYADAQLKGSSNKFSRLNGVKVLCQTPDFVETQKISKVVPSWSEKKLDGELERSAPLRTLGVLSSGLGLGLTSSLLFPLHSAALALPGYLDKFRKLEEASEQVVAGVRSGKVIDKIIQVTSGQLVASEFSFETIGSRLKGIVDGDPAYDQLIQDAVSDASDFVRETWTSWIEAVLEFNPVVGSLESLWAGIFTIVEGLIERISAVEFSLLVGIGERWLIFAPFVILPMWWQMTRNPGPTYERRNDLEEARIRKLEAEKSVRRERVLRKLRKMEAMAAIEDTLASLGQAALEANSEPFSAKRRELSDRLSALVEMGPQAGWGPEQGEFPELERETLSLEGRWKLVFIGDFSVPPALSDVPPLSYEGILSVGLKIYGGEQTVEHTEASGEPSVFAVRQKSMIGVDNVARLDANWSGKWDPKANLTFDTVTVTPWQFLGSAASQLLPAVQLPLPGQIQRPLEWKNLYFDQEFRVDRGFSGSLLAFKRLPSDL